MRDGKRPRTWWGIAGITTGVVLAIAGLVVVGIFVVFVVGLSTYGSNK
jgi:hypothetical protein